MTIKSLQSLIDELEKCTAKEAVGLVKHLDLDAKEFENTAFWSDAHYTRNCVARNDHFELLLLCWEPGQITPIHCHGGQECWVYGVSGSIQETRFKQNENKQLEEIASEVMGHNGLSYMVDEMGYHHLKNVGEDRAMTLHLYMDPIDKCRIFDGTSGDFHWKTMTYYSMDGQLLETA